MDLDALKKILKPTEEVEKIARFLEDLIREDDREKKLYPSLKRIPKEDDSWIGWVGSAKDLIKLLNEEK